jgi:hypothetical protein
MSRHLKTHQIAQSAFEFAHVNCSLENGAATLVIMTFVRSTDIDTTDQQYWYVGWQEVVVLIVV